MTPRSRLPLRIRGWLRSGFRMRMEQESGDCDLFESPLFPFLEDFQVPFPIPAVGQK